MQVIAVPGRLKTGTLVLWASILWAAAESALASRAPWWRLPYVSMAIWSGVAALVMIPLSHAMSRGKRWAWLVAAVVAWGWIVLSGWFAYRMEMVSLAYFTIFLMIFFISVLGWIRSGMGASFLDPKMAWYQGLPKPLPGLICEAQLGDRKFEFQVARLDREGTFLFNATDPAEEVAERIRSGQAATSELLFKFRHRELRCQGVPRTVLKRAAGAGVQFMGLAPDAMKELGDFVEVLRGEGYVVE